jgi:hypothetical protein
MDKGVHEHCFLMAAFLKAGKEILPLICAVPIYGMACLALFFTQGLMLFSTLRPRW